MLETIRRTCRNCEYVGDMPLERIGAGLAEWMCPECGEKADNIPPETRQ